MDTNKTLDELQQEAHKLEQLLKERETGMVTWWDFLYERLDKIQSLKQQLQTSSHYSAKENLR